jgi:hypothetical protein
MSKSKPDKFTAHFDGEWKTQRSKIRDVRTERFNYSPMYSWEARSDDPREFSKLNADQLPSQPCRPCTLSGNRVIELEPSEAMEVLNVARKPIRHSELRLMSKLMLGG